MQEQVEKLQTLMSEASVEAAKFINGNNAAGTRTRKYLQEIKTLSTEIRAEVTSIKNVRKYGTDVEPF